MSTREQAQTRANRIGEPVMIVTDGTREFWYEGDPMDLTGNLRIVETVEPTR